MDGRIVCLHEEWYHVHILQRKREIGEWLAEPLHEIERALTQAVEVRWQPEYDRPLYVGPLIGKGFMGNNRLKVSVQPQDSNGGVVVTVIVG